MTKKMIQLCKTKYSMYSNNYDNCMKEEIDGCDGCDWYVTECILNMFEMFEKKPELLRNQNDQM